MLYLIYGANTVIFYVYTRLKNDKSLINLFKIFKFICYLLEPLRIILINITYKLALSTC